MNTMVFKVLLEHDFKAIVDEVHKTELNRDRREGPLSPSLEWEWSSSSLL